MLKLNELILKRKLFLKGLLMKSALNFDLRRII